MNAPFSGSDPSGIGVPADWVSRLNGRMELSPFNPTYKIVPSVDSPSAAGLFPIAIGVPITPVTGSIVTRVLGLFTAVEGMEA